jgi:hypothetical protein
LERSADCKFEKAEKVVDLAVWMSPEVLEHKLEASDDENHETTWNIASLPEGFSSSKLPHRLFVASNGHWRGWFLLADEVLWNPQDAQAPFALIFDTTTWTPIQASAARRFRGVRPLREVGCEIANEGDT